MRQEPTTPTPPFFPATALAVLVLTVGLTAAPSAASPRDPRLGPAPQPEDAWWLRPPAEKTARGGGLSVDTSNRQAVADFFATVYEPAFAVPMGWTGSIAGCVAGTTSAAYRQATLDVVNFFRAMSGLPGDVVFDPALDAKDQDAALMMIAEGETNHFPDPTFACYTVEGDEAAGASNLALDFAGPDAILAYVNDFGAPNEPVGHRRWILYPPQMDMGTGSTSGVNGGLVGSHALWTVENAFGPRPAQPEWVAFPNPGYVPWELVFPPSMAGFAANRWSLSRNLVMADYPPGDATVDFSLATVEMSEGGVPITVDVVSRTDQFGDATLVWEPVGMGFVPGSMDRAIDVSVEDVEVDGVLRDFAYQVILFDPEVAVDEIFADGFESGDTSGWGS